MNQFFYITEKYFKFLSLILLNWTLILKIKNKNKASIF